MKVYTKNKGFTLTEILVVIAVIVLIAAISVFSLRSLYISTTIRSGAEEVFGSLSDARSSSLSSQNDSVHSVHFSTTTVTRFEGDTYVDGAAENKVYNFEGRVAATSSIIDDGGVVTFAKITGIPSATGTIVVYDRDETGSTSVQIHRSGLIEFN
jgi:prepilin-type N-terminal cleavage/methylation domain-containing protein